MNLKLKVAFCCFLLLVFLDSSEVTAQKADHFKAKKSILQTVDQSLAQSVEQYKYLMQQLSKDEFPRTFKDGKVLTVTPFGWISGFYPGTLLYLYEDSGDSVLLNEALDRLCQLEKVKTVTRHHDLGFMMYSSYGNAYRLNKISKYKDILVRSAKSLATRFHPVVESIESWDQVKSLDGERMLEFPVIIDNLINLELLFFASRATGDPYYRIIAVKHAETTLKNHLRSDYSSYHVVNYDIETGKVKSKETQQGYADNSTWARGQAWGIYGFTMIYRETKDKKYLKAASKMADFFLEHPNLPKDKVPYWDFNVNQPGYTPPWGYDPSKYPVVPRDASAAAITASALIELATYVDTKAAQQYWQAAGAILESLSSPKYRALKGKNGGFILMHASGGVPGNIEVDVPLSYADYYYVEALMRYKAQAR